MVRHQVVALAICGSLANAAIPNADEFRVANALGDAMVLQRDIPVALWGFGASSGAVNVTIGEESYSGTAKSDGSWRVDSIGPFAAGDHGDIVVRDSSGATITLLDVLWGDVFLCSGQSNMVFAVSQAYSAAEDISAANNPKYQSIRIFTSQPTFSSNPALEFPNVEQSWTRANGTTIGNSKPFSYFSSVCWLTGKKIFDDLDGTVPIGLLCSAVGGTRVHSWSGPDAIAKCNQSVGADTKVHRQKRMISYLEESGENSRLWNGMIFPVLSMQFKAAFWLQGESDVNPSDTLMEPQRGGKYYSCAIKAMVIDWRKKFNQKLPFIWVQLSPWVGHEAATSLNQLPAIRQAQLSVNELPNTGFASAVDLGDINPTPCDKNGEPSGCNPWDAVHWRNKRPIGTRLAAVAAHLLYNAPPSVQFEGPQATRATLSGSQVTIYFDADSIGQGASLVQLPNVCPFIALNQTANILRCGWLETRVANGNWTNSTFAVGSHTLTIDTVPDVAEVRYLYADWPVATVFNTAGFPATPFVLPIE